MTAVPYRPADLVFIQNGMLEPFLNQRGLGDNTQVSACCASDVTCAPRRFRCLESVTLWPGVCRTPA